MQAYLASVEFVDHCLGKVIDALDDGPNGNNTWIFLTGDHGWHLGEKEIWAKRTLWERSTRVPMMIIPPANSKQFANGAICDLPVEILSFYPTMVEVSGIDPNKNTEGKSLVPLLIDPDASTWTEPAITTHLKGNHSVRAKDWRYTRYADGSEELYDHRSDPNEWKNIATSPGSKKVIAELKKWLPKTNADPAEGRNPYAKGRKEKKVGK